MSRNLVHSYYPNHTPVYQADSATGSPYQYARLNCLESWIQFLLLIDLNFVLLVFIWFQNALLEFKKVANVKEQVVAGTMYHITLEASEGGKNKVYEAKVWVKPWMNFKEVQEFKHVGDA